MSGAFWILLLCLSSAVLLLWVRRVSLRLQASRRELDGIESGEQRMFDFLHVLGVAIEEGGSEKRQLFPDIREDMFISMAYLVIDGREGRVRLARAGHDAPLWFRKRSGKVSEVRSPGLAVGIDDGGVFERTTRDHEFELEAGDCLLLHTDGVREALDDDEREYGIERTIEVFGDASLIGAESAVDAIQRDLESFSGSAPQMDDITLIAIEKR